MTGAELTVISGEDDDMTAPGPDHPAWRGLGRRRSRHPRDETRPGVRPKPRITLIRTEETHD